MTNNIKEKLNPLIQKLNKLTKVDVVYLAKGGFWINSTSAVSSIVSLILSILFARYVPKDIFGIYKYIISIASIAAAFSLTGMNVAVMKAVAQGHDGIFKKSIIEQLKWSWIQLLFMWSFSAYYFYQGNSTYGTTFLAISILSILSCVTNTYNAVLYGKKDFKTSAIYGITASGFNLFLMALIIFYQSTSVFLLVSTYYAATAAANAYFCFKTYRRYKMNEQKEFLASDITYGKHVSVMGAISTLAAQLDNVLVYHLLGPASLATYSFATVIPERIRVSFSFISAIAFPKIAKNKQSDLNNNLNNKVIQLIFTGLVISLFYALIAPFLFHWLFPQYNSSIVYSQVFSISLVAIALNISNTALLAKEKQKHLYFVNTIIPIIKIVLTVLGIWFFGIWGAIISRIASQIILLSTTTYFSKNI